MGNIRKIKKSEIDRYNDIVANAYTGSLRDDPERKKKFRSYIERMINEDKRSTLYAYFNGSDMQGVMRILDLKMNYRGTMIKTTGIGLVGVDLMNKKKGIARELLHYYLEYSRKSDANISTLYPFRPDFYNKMGYGYGTPVSEYVIAPSQIAFKKNRDNICNLNAEHSAQIIKCYDTYKKNHHGLFDMSEDEISGVMKSEKVFKIGYFKKNVLKGFIFYSFDKVADGSEFDNDIKISLIIHNMPEALNAMMDYLYTQLDQVSHIHFYVQNNDMFRIFRDIRYKPYSIYFGPVHQISRDGMSIMYRIVDFRQFVNQVKHIRFGNIDINMEFDIDDSFMSINNNQFSVQFINGKPNIRKSVKTDVTIKCNIADLSALLMGSVSLKSSIELGLIRISNNKYIDKINHAFNTGNKPMCMTAF